VNETERQEYLKVMGIAPVYLRRSVALGRPVAEYVFAEPAAASTSEAKQPSRTRNKSELEKPVARPRPERVTAPGAVAAKPVTKASEVPAQPAQASSADGLRFKLDYICAGPNLAVVQEYPFQQAESGTEARTLLAAILRAIGLPDDSYSLHAESFNWPLAEGLATSGSDIMAAGRALAGFLRKRQETDGFSELLVFSTQLAEVLNNVELDAVSVTHTHSLHAMLANPGLKREAWSDLQAARQRLQPGSAE